MDQLGEPSREKRRYHHWSVQDDLIVLKRYDELGPSGVARLLNRHYVQDAREKLSPAGVWHRYHLLQRNGLTDLRCAGCGKAEPNGGEELWCPVRECPVPPESPACRRGRVLELRVMRGDV